VPTDLPLWEGNTLVQVVEFYISNGAASVTRDELP
jgi:hypothetical protein